MVFACLATGAHCLEADLDVTVKSDASYRGVRQAFDDKPVYQAQLEMRRENGLYAGVWGSRANSIADSRDSEVDFYVGFQRRWNHGFATDFTLQRYTYQGAEFGKDYDWNELQVAAHLGDHFTVLGAVGDNWIGRNERSYLLEGTYRYALSAWLSGYATVGHQFAEQVVGRDFSYREAGLGVVLAGFDVVVSWTDTTGFDHNPFLTDDTWQVSLSRRIRLTR